MNPTIWRFLLFLGSELLFVIVATVALFFVGFLIVKNRALKNSYATIAALLFEFVSPLFLFLFMLILTGKSYFALFAVLTAISIAMI